MKWQLTLGTIHSPFEILFQIGTSFPLQTQFLQGENVIAMKNEPAHARYPVRAVEELTEKHLKSTLQMRD